MLARDGDELIAIEAFVPRLDRVTPAYAVAIWASALALRALASVIAALLVVLVLPHSPALDSFSHWCLSAALPLIGVNVELNGHRVSDAATLLPTLIVGGRSAP